ncbi:MAG: polyprenyl synthetase family protein [Rhodobacteraceae bacterium]|nr:polyprenyl synthetase family protein [Paracoccaceae bacterium]
MTEFTAAIVAHAATVEQVLEELLPSVHGPEGRVVDAMRYAVLGGGKRLRAFLVLESAQLFDVAPTSAKRTAAAIECMHAYSLIHDDLPCMDDDDMRRGKPTTHLAFDEATAVLAGDALQSLAFEILLDPSTHANGEIRARLASALARAAGANGMVGGQMIDIQAEREALRISASGLDLTPGEPTRADVDAIARLQRLKTGALFEFSATSGALLADQDPEPLSRYAAAFGLAFQIRDDLLDVEGDEQAAGKRLRKDADMGKATFVGLMGVDGAGRRARELVAEASAALEPYGGSATLLRQAADFALHRTR